MQSQAVDRAHRIGQERRAFPYRLIAKETVEKGGRELQAAKGELAEAVVRETPAPLPTSAPKTSSSF